MASIALGQSTTMTVNANQGPWEQSANPNFTYGYGDNAAPAIISTASGIPFAPGGKVTVTYLSGQVNVFPEGGYPATDANGATTETPTNNTVVATYGSYPSYFASASSYPIYASELIGTFANNGVIVGTPFPIGDGPKTFTIPAGANQLLLGVDDNDYSDNTGSWQIKVTYAAGSGSSTGNPGCYQFSGPSVTLNIDITSFTSKDDNQTSSTGYTSKDLFEGNNSLTAGGATKTSQSTSNSPDCVGCLLGSVIFSYDSSTDLTIFTMTVPADDTPGDMNSWFATLGGFGNLFPGGVLPQSTAFPPISSWPVNAQITVASGGKIASYTITSIGSCSLGGSGGGSSPSISTVVSASAFGDFSSAAPGSWVEIYGSNLAPDTRGWTGTDFTGPGGDTAPITLDGVSVSIGGQAAFVDYISSAQVNAELPSNIPTGGPLALTVTNGSATSAPVNLMIKATQPGLLAPSNFKIGGNQYVVAQHSDGTYVLPAGAIAGLSTRPAEIGETIVIYGVGFGSVTPNIPAGEIVAGDNHLSESLQIKFGSTAAQMPLPYYGLAPNFVGLYQFDVVVPSVASSNLVPLSFTLGGTAGTQTLFTAVQ
jgi:uncharacterized protein (TIGR03437 family)